MPSFQFNIDTLKTCARLCSTDGTRMAINGVHCLLLPGSNVVFEATDGRRLVRHTTPFEHDANKATSFIIPATAINDAPIHRPGAPDRLTMADGEVRMRLTNLSVICAPIDAHYPATYNVIPDVLPTTFPAIQVALCDRFLRDMLTLMQDLSHPQSNDVTIVSKGEFEPLLFVNKTTTAALMPMRIS